MVMTKANYDTAVSIFFAVYFGLPIFILLLYLFGRIRVVEQGTAVLVERMGRFHRRLDAGLHFLVPFIDQTRPVIWRSADVFTEKTWGNNTRQKVQIRQMRSDVIDLRESLMDFPSQSVIARDNVKLDVHVMLLYRLVDPVRVAYEAYDLPHAIQALVQTTIRSIVGEMSLDDTLSSREEIERSLKLKIARVALDWGLEIRSVEVLEISPSSLVQEAMHQQLAAERVRRAAIVSADGQREKVKLEAEGDCQAAVALATGERQVAIVRAQGLADARRLIARAEADAVRIIGGALSEFGVDPTQYVIATKYIDSLTSAACSAGSREVYFPLEQNVSGALSALAVGAGAASAAAAAGRRA